MENKFNLSYVLLVCIPLYLSQGIILPQGLLPQILLALWLSIDLYYIAYYLLDRRKDSLANIILLFWAVNVISWLISPKEIYTNGYVIRTLDHFKNLTVALLTYFPYAYWIRQGLVREKYLKWFTLIMFALAVVMFWDYNTRALFERTSDSITNNEAYIFVTLFPLIYLFRDKKIIWYALLFAVLFLVLYGAKRGAIICYFVQLILFILYSNTAIKGRRNSKAWGFVLVLVLFIAIGYVTYNLIQGNEYLLWRISNMQEGNDASGEARLFQYNKILQTFVDAPVYNKLFGFGFNQSVSLTHGYYAHNDWLEILASQGILGVLLYFIFFIRLWRTLKIIGDDGWRKCMFFLAFFPWIIRSIVSMGYVSMETFYFIIAVAYVKYSSSKSNYNLKYTKFHTERFYKKACPIDSCLICQCRYRK